MFKAGVAAFFITLLITVVCVFVAIGIVAVVNELGWIKGACP